MAQSFPERLQVFDLALDRRVYTHLLPNELGKDGAIRQAWKTSKSNQKKGG